MDEDVLCTNKVELRSGKGGATLDHLRSKIPGFGVVFESVWSGSLEWHSMMSITLGSTFLKLLKWCYGCIESCLNFGETHSGGRAISGMVFGYSRMLLHSFGLALQPSGMAFWSFGASFFGHNSFFSTLFTILVRCSMFCSIAPWLILFFHSLCHLSLEFLN